MGNTNRRDLGSGAIQGSGGKGRPNPVVKPPKKKKDLTAAEKHRAKTEKYGSNRAEWGSGAIRGSAGKGPDSVGPYGKNRSKSSGKSSDKSSGKGVHDTIGDAAARFKSIGESGKTEIGKKKDEKKKKKKSLIDKVKGALTKGKHGVSAREAYRRKRKSGKAVTTTSLTTGKGKKYDRHGNVIKKKKTNKLTHKQKVAAEVKRLAAGGKPFQSKVDKSDWTAADYAADYQDKADRKAKINSGGGAKPTSSYMTNIKKFQAKASKLGKSGTVNL